MAADAILLTELLGNLEDEGRWLLQVRRYSDGRMGYVLAKVQPNDTVWMEGEDIPAPRINALFDKAIQPVFDAEL